MHERDDVRAVDGTERGFQPMPVPVGMVNPWVVPVHHVGIVPNPTADAVAVAVAAVVAVANATCTGILFSLV